MIPGIEVLSQELVAGANNGLVVLGFLFVSIFIACCIILLVLSFMDNNYLLVGIALLCALLAALIGVETNKEMSKKTHTEYKVLISDDVSWNEFNKKYEIIEQEGKIYTIKQRAE